MTSRDMTQKQFDRACERHEIEHTIEGNEHVFSWPGCFVRARIRERELGTRRLLLAYILRRLEQDRKRQERHQAVRALGRGSGIEYFKLGGGFIPGVVVEPAKKTSGDVGVILRDGKRGRWPIDNVQPAKAYFSLVDALRAERDRIAGDLARVDRELEQAEHDRSTD